MAENVDIVIRNAVEGIADVRQAAQRIRELGGDATQTETAAEGLAGELNTLGNQQRLIQQFSTVRRELGQTETQLGEARKRAADLGKEFNSTAQPSARLTREFERARKEVRELNNRQLQQRRTLQDLRGTLNQAGVSTNNLSEAQRRINQQTQQARQRFDQLRGSVDRSEQELRQASTATQRLRADFATIGIKPFTDVQREVTQTRAALARLGASGQLSGQQMAQATQAANARIRELQGTTQQASGSVSRLGGSVRGLAIGLLGGAGLVQGIRGSVAAIGNFEQSMARVRAISGATDEEFRQLTATARELGATTQFSATQAADGLGFLSQAGFTAEESIAALPGVLDLAAAGQLDLGRSADIASNVLQGFNLEASESARIADVLAQTARSANTDVEQLGEAMSFVAPVAANLGISVEDTAAAVGALSNAGIQGSRAGTGLARVFTRLLNPTAQAQRAIEGLGLRVKDLNPQLNSITDIVGRFRDAGLSAADAAVIFGDRGGPAIQALVGQADGLQRLTDTIRDSGGAAQEVAEVMRDTLRGDFNELKSAAEALALSVGEGGLTGALRALVQSLTAVVRAIDSLPAGATTAAAAVASLTAAAVALAAAKRVLGALFPQVTARIAAQTPALAANAAAMRTSTAAATRLGAALSRLGVAGLALAAGGPIAVGLAEFAASFSEAARRADESRARVRESLQAEVDALRVQEQQLSKFAGAVQLTTRELQAATEADLQATQQRLDGLEQLTRVQISAAVREQELARLRSDGSQAAEEAIKAQGERIAELGARLRQVRTDQERVNEQLAIASSEFGRLRVAAADAFDATLRGANDVLTAFEGLEGGVQQLSGRDLAELRVRAEESLQAAQAEVERLGGQLASLQGASAEVTQAFVADFGRAEGAVNGLRGAAESLRDEMLRRLGVDASQVLSGIRSETVELLDTFDALATNSSEDFRLIQASAEQLLGRLNSPAELEAFRRSLQAAARNGFDVRDALRAVDAQLASTGAEAQRQGEEVRRVTDEYRSLGDTAEDAGRRAEAAHRGAAGAAREQAAATRSITESNAISTIASRDSSGTTSEPGGPLNARSGTSVKGSLLRASDTAGLTKDITDQILQQINTELDRLNKITRQDTPSGVLGLQGILKFNRSQTEIIERGRREAQEARAAQQQLLDAERQVNQARLNDGLDQASLARLQQQLSAERIQKFFAREAADLFDTARQLSISPDRQQAPTQQAQTTRTVNLNLNLNGQRVALQGSQSDIDRLLAELQRSQLVSSAA